MEKFNGPHHMPSTESKECFSKYCNNQIPLSGFVCFQCLTNEDPDEGNVFYGAQHHYALENQIVPNKMSGEYQIRNILEYYDAIYIGQNIRESENNCCIGYLQHKFDIQELSRKIYEFPEETITFGRALERLYFLTSALYEWEE